MTTPAAPTPPQDLSETTVERIAVRIEQREATNPRHRIVEDGLAVVGIAIAALYGSLEALRNVGWSLGPCESTKEFPWVTIIIFLGCVLPKTVGRATAGKVWDALGSRIGVGK